MPNSDLTLREIRAMANTAFRNLQDQYIEVRKLRGSRRTRAVYKFLAEVRHIAFVWRKESPATRAVIEQHLNHIAGRNFRTKRSLEFMLLRIAVTERQIHSAWSKAANLAREHKVPPRKTARWLTDNGGIDYIIRNGVTAEE